MSNVIVVNNSLIQYRAKATWGAVPSTLTPVLRLFVNNVVPACTDTTATYTTCTLSGYTDVPLTYANWVQSTVLCVTTFTYPTVTWTFSAGGQTIYGHYYYDSTSGIVLMSYQWPTSYAVPVGGGQVQITPQWIDQQC